MTKCRGIRGATTADYNTRESIFAAAQELFEEIVEVNGVQESQIAAALFTTTEDLNAAFPATAIRKMGWQNTALLCSHEIAVPDGLHMCIRLLLLVNTDMDIHDLRDVYLKGAVGLRTETEE